MALILTETNSELAEDGAPFEMGDVTFFVRSAKYGPYMKAVSSFFQKRRKSGLSSMELAIMANRETVPVHLISRWEGEIRTPDGKIHTYKSPKQAKALLGNEMGDDVLAAINEFANDRANYERQEIEELGGKLQAV